MMMWRKKKTSSPSLSQSSSTSSIFHLSWFSKIKKTKKNLKCKPEKGESNLGCKGMQMPMSWKNGKSYGGDDGSDWRLSFEEENYEVEKSRGGLKSVWYDSKNENENENQEFNFPSCQSCQIDDAVEKEEVMKFNQMVSNIRKLKILPHCEGMENREYERIGRKSEKEQKLRKRNKEDLEEKKIDFEKQMGGVYELKPVKLTRATKGENRKKEAFSSNRIFETVEEDYKLEALSLDEEKLEMKLKELMEKNENQRKSVYISTVPQMKTTKSTSKVRAYSPRTAHKIECKIKAIENMKRAKKKTQKKLMNKPAKERTVFDSFAVVKSSFDPQSDFKKSMIEMITVKGITKAQELEELLACYLTLNADVYHDTIIKVFKQVWFELIQDHLAPAI